MTRKPEEFGDNLPTFIFAKVGRNHILVLNDGKVDDKTHKKPKKSGLLPGFGKQKWAVNLLENI